MTHKPSLHLAVADCGMAHPPLPLLEPMQVLPDQYSDRSRALTLLRRIDCLQIRENVTNTNGRHYAIDLYYKQAPHGIPTNHNSSRNASPSSTRPHSVTPDARVLRRFSEFGNVCDEMYFHAHTGHDHSPCVFCAAFTKYATASATQPRLLMKLLHSEEQIRRRLERFLNDVLRMTVSGVKAFGGRDCLGQEHVPLLLLEFLLPHEMSPLGAQAAQMSVQALRNASDPRARATVFSTLEMV